MKKQLPEVLHKNVDRDFEWESAFNEARRATLSAADAIKVRNAAVARLRQLTLEAAEHEQVAA